MSWKDWVTGDTPTEAEFDQLQRQGINSFDDATDRDTDITLAKRQAGMLTVVHDTGEFNVWNPDITPSGEWVKFGRYKEWGVYTPVLTATSSNPNLGTGPVQFGRWIKEGTAARVAIFLQFGSASIGVGSGIYEVSLPTECPVAADWFTGIEIVTGAGFAIENSSGLRRQMAIKVIGTSKIRLEADGLTGPVTESNLIAWDVSDIIVSTTFEYETEK
jgi:hypothetical protein